MSKPLIKKIVHYRALACLMIMSILFLRCKDDISGGGTIDIVFPATGVSYGKQVQPLFDRGCAFTGCHSSEDPQNGPILDSYQNALSSDLGVITPGDTASSRIVWSIEALHGKTRMPPPPQFSPLTDNQIKGIKRWILEGAQNN